MAYARRQQGPEPTQSEPFSVVDDVDERLTRGKAPAVFEEDRFPLLAIGVPRIATDLDTRSVLAELKHKIRFTVLGGRGGFPAMPKRRESDNGRHAGRRRTPAEQ